MNISDIKHWLKNNLFSNWYYSLISLFIFYLLLITLPPFLDWALIKATFIGNSKTDCQPGGACWVFIKVWFEKLIYGFYPEKEIWRVNLAFLILISTVILAFFVKSKFKIYILFFLIFIFPLIGFTLINGGFGLERVETRVWGGLTLTFILTFFGIIVAFPLGVLLALGRRSELPIFRFFSILFIYMKIYLLKNLKFPIPLIDIFKFYYFFSH